MITSATALGLRDYQEDTYFTATMEQGTLLAVFDGHGGGSCSRFLFENFLFTFMIELEKFVTEEENVALALKQTFASLDAKTRDGHAGSTASVVFIPNDAKRAIVAVLGDSPVIAALRTSTSSSAPAVNWHVSPEHNVRTNHTERDQAIQRGGFFQNGYVYNTPTRWSDYARGLQMGRAFGDAEMGAIVTKEPEIYEIPLGKWLLVCTDGAVDPGHGDAGSAINKIITLVEQGGDAQAIVDRALAARTGDQAIVDRALAARTGDNVTVILWRAE